MVSDEIMLKVENVSKIYRLGEIGGTTLREEFQRLSAKIRKKPDPTKKVGAKDYNKGEKFKALNGVSFVAKKGERIGIIGHNGAGKSTLLKLISRVTGPSEGSIHLNGRVASMLEVGTGFHPELTGRENIYMNGAILGMTKKEIDAKMEDIIEFSEVRQFIDTPVKRYSSGMYVKLAFSVAAHLNSEIMIMDEVLAVGDVSFQDKCLNKMKTVSEQQDKTILYVSHNMNTIRKLCDRVLVFDHGKIIYDGDVQHGIDIYMGIFSSQLNYQFLDEHHKILKSKDFTIRKLEILGKESALFEMGESIKYNVFIEALKKFKNVRLCLSLYNSNGIPVGTSFSNFIDFKKGCSTVRGSFSTISLTPGKYIGYVIFFVSDKIGYLQIIDCVYPGIVFEMSTNLNSITNLHWNAPFMGSIHLEDNSLIVID